MCLIGQMLAGRRTPQTRFWNANQKQSRSHQTIKTSKLLKYFHQVLFYFLCWCCSFCMFRWHRCLFLQNLTLESNLENFSVVRDFISWAFVETYLSKTFASSCMSCCSLLLIFVLIACCTSCNWSTKKKLIIHFKCPQTVWFKLVNLHITET